MVEDVGDLFGEQPRVQRMQHRAHAGDGVVQLEVPEIIPGHRRDAVARPDPGRGERVSELARAPEDVGVGAAMTRMIGGHRDDLGRGVDSLGVPQDRGDRER